MAGLVPAIQSCVIDVEGYDPPEGWGFVDETFVDLPTTAEQVGPIKRWV